MPWDRFVDTDRPASVASLGLVCLQTNEHNKNNQPGECAKTQDSCTDNSLRNFGFDYRKFVSGKDTGCGWA